MHQVYLPVLPGAADEQITERERVQETGWRGGHACGGQRGSRTRTDVPSFSLLSMLIVPPCASAMLRQIASPRPAPPVRADRAASTR